MHRPFDLAWGRDFRKFHGQQLCIQGQADGRLPSLGRAIWACGDACGLIGLDWVRNAPHASHARPAARHSDSALSSQSESPPRLATPRRASPCLALPCLTSHRIHPNQRSFASDPTRSLSASFAHIHIHIQRWSGIHHRTRPTGLLPPPSSTDAHRSLNFGESIVSIHTPSVRCISAPLEVVRHDPTELIAAQPSITRR